MIKNKVSLPLPSEATQRASQPPFSDHFKTKTISIDIKIYGTTQRRLRMEIVVENIVFLFGFVCRRQQQKRWSQTDTRRE